MVHESQVFLSLIQAPVIETKDGLKPAWNWGQCALKSNCPLNTDNDKIISKLLIRLQEHDFQQSSNDFRLILKSFQSKKKNSLSQTIYKNISDFFSQQFKIFKYPVVFFQIPQEYTHLKKLAMKTPMMLAISLK